MNKYLKQVGDGALYLAIVAALTWLLHYPVLFFLKFFRWRTVTGRNPRTGRFPYPQERGRNDE